MQLPFGQTRLMSVKYFLWLFLFWQAIAVYLMAVGAWPLWVVWLTAAVSAIFIVLASSYHAVLLLILSIPFYVALPYVHNNSIASWRALFVLAFVVWLVRFIREIWDDVAAPRPFKEKFNRLFAAIRELFNPWDRYAGLLLLVMLGSVFIARFPVESIKQIIFLFNLYLLYILAAACVRTKEQIAETIKYAAVSMAIIVGLGYVQLAVTFILPQTFFWQYWATHVSQLYYGPALAHVLTYSNSWFSYVSAVPELRMFSIMPDSHSFAVVAVFLIGFTLALTSLYLSKKSVKKKLAQAPTQEPAQAQAPPADAGMIKNLMPSKAGYLLWNSIRLSGLAIIFSGTRGVWVGLLPPLTVSVWLFFRRRARPIMKKMIITALLIILFFALSPLINGALDYLRVSTFQENFLQRASTIYDLTEDSNLGRLIIWENSLRYGVSHPLGVGLGNFVVSLVENIPSDATFDQVAGQNNLRYNLPQKFVSAHSLYLDILVELGVVGLIVFLAFWGSYFGAVGKFFRRFAGEDNVYVTFVVTLGFIFLWLLAYGIFDVTLFNDKILMYTFISLALSGTIMRRPYSH